jgi:hypothetical protein
MSNRDSFEKPYIGQAVGGGAEFCQTLVATQHYTPNSSRQNVRTRIWTNYLHNSQIGRCHNPKDHNPHILMVHPPFLPDLPSSLADAIQLCLLCVLSRRVEFEGHFKFESITSILTLTCHRWLHLPSHFFLRDLRMFTHFNFLRSCYKSCSPHSALFNRSYIRRWGIQLTVFLITFLSTFILVTF